MKMSVGVLDHYNVSTRKLNDTVQFYEDILGFMNGPRPPFDGRQLPIDGDSATHPPGGGPSSSAHQIFALHTAPRLSRRS